MIRMENMMTQKMTKTQLEIIVKKFLNTVIGSEKEEFEYCFSRFFSFLDFIYDQGMEKRFFDNKEFK